MLLLVEDMLRVRFTRVEEVGAVHVAYDPDMEFSDSSMSDEDALAPRARSSAPTMRRQQKRSVHDVGPHAASCSVPSARATSFQRLVKRIKKSTTLPCFILGCLFFCQKLALGLLCIGG
jgi:hypothetical protein